MPAWHPDDYASAWRLASRAHAGQTYGGEQEGERIAYINHLASVAMEVSWAIALEAEQGQSRDARLAIQCALLHDTVEDTATTVAELTQHFGAAVAAGVLALSKNPDLPKEQQLPDSLQRILQQAPEVAMVKLADRITNLYHPPFYWDKDKILSYRDEAQLILNRLGHVSAPLAQRLAHKIAIYPQFITKLS